MQNKGRNKDEEVIIRVRTPKGNETIGCVLAMLGGGRLQVKCEDGFTRICRIPGKIKKRVWIRPGYLILLKPWDIQKEERGDVILSYSKAQVAWLKSRGFIKNIASCL